MIGVPTLCYVGIPVRGAHTSKGLGSTPGAFRCLARDARFIDTRVQQDRGVTIKSTVVSLYFEDDAVLWRILST